MLDNIINLISTNEETDYEEGEVIDEEVEDLVEANNLDRNFTDTNKKQKLKKKVNYNHQKLNTCLKEKKCINIKKN